MKTRITLTQEDMMLISYILENINNKDSMEYCKRENNSDINYLKNKLNKQIKKNYALISKMY
tara:strand:+ start:320 stop:505 length:186 start_codon:yes stop_codon:yes gene_type:complete